MLNRRGFLLVMVSLTLGLAAAWMANAWVQQRLNGSGAAAESTIRVVTAAIAIPYGHRVEPRHLRVIDVPRGTPLGDYFTDPFEVEGQVSLQSTLPGEVLLRPRFSEHAGGSTLAAAVDPDMRAVTVRVNDVIGLAGFLLPNNRVDVLGTRMDNRRAITETILRNIRVLAVDQRTNPDREEPMLVRAVTLEVTPAQAELLVKAREEGTLQLTLRNPRTAQQDDQEEEDEPVVQAPPPPPPPRPAAAPRPVVRDVTVIRGVRVETVRPGN